MSNQLTAEQQRKIEENRRKALERRAQRLGQAASTDKQTSTGFSTTSSHIEPQKQAVVPRPAAPAPHRVASSSGTAPKRFAPPPQIQLQNFTNQKHGSPHQHLSGSGTRINNTNSASSKQVRFGLSFLIWMKRGYFFLYYYYIIECLYSQTQLIDPLPIVSNQHGSSPGLYSGGSIGVKPVQSKPNLTSSSSAAVAGSFYKQGASRSAQSSVAQLPSSSSTLNTVPAKKPAISVRGKCVPHSEGRFRVEVSYHAELIAAFKSIPSKTYGKHLPV